MTELQRLCAALSVDDADEESLYRLFRWFGFRGFTIGLHAHLDFLVDLAAPMQRIAVLYPNLEPACSVFLKAENIRERLKSVLNARETNCPENFTDAQRNEFIYADFETRLPEVLRHDRTMAPNSQHADIGAEKRKGNFQLPLSIPRAVNDVPMALLMYAASYLLVRIWDGHALTQPACKRVVWKFGGDQRLDELWARGSEPHVLMERQTIQDACKFILPHAQALANESQGIETSWQPWPVNEEEYLDFHAMLAQTDLTKLYYPMLSEPAQLATSARLNNAEVDEESNDDGTSEDDMRRWGNRDSPLLDDRELLPEWTYGLTESEHQSLISLVRKAPSIESTKFVTRDQVISGMAGCLTLTALVTSNTVKVAAKSRSVTLFPSSTKLDTDRLPQDEVFRYIFDGVGRATRVTWTPYSPDSLKTELLLEHFDVGITSLHRDCLLDELSPIPVEEMITEIRKFIAHQIGKTDSQADLCIKHLLARTLFAANANRGIIKHLCSHAPKLLKNGSTSLTMEVRSESLSNYIHPNCKAVHDAFGQAVEHLRLSSYKPLIAKQKKAIEIGKSQWISPANMLQTVDWLAKRALNRGGVDVLEHHNHFVLYVAIMLVMATGHRRARALFPFIFTLDLEDRLAFIADKMREGSEARFVPLIDMVVCQLKEYQAHILWLIDQLQTTKPDLADDIRGAVGLRRLKKTDHAHVQTGTLFIIRRGRLAPVSTAAIDLTLAQSARALGLPNVKYATTKLLRRHLATCMADRGTSGMQIELLFGHNGDQHALGAASSWVPLEQLNILRPTISQYMQEHGWSTITASWASDYLGRFKAPLPAIEQSSYAYEGRALKAGQAKILARQAILKVIPAQSLLDDQTIDLDDNDLKRIREAIKRQHMADPVSLQEILTAFDRYAESWRNDQRFVAPRAELLRPRWLGKTATDCSDADLKDTAVDSESEAQAAIQAAALKVLPKSKLRGGRAIAMDDAMVRALKQQLAQDLEEKPLVRSKILTAFAELAASWRRSGKYRVSAASINLARFSPGPIEIVFPRHLAIAKEIVRNLPQVLEDVLSNSTVSPTERLGAILVMMIVGEAVLEKNELKQVMVDVQEGCLTQYEGQLQVRAAVTGRAADYDRTVDLNYKTSAAILGYLRKRKLGEIVDFGSLEVAANKLLLSIVYPRNVVNVDKLLFVMRPYWFMRLPASVYATMVGNQDCNAPSEMSMKLLLGAEPPILKFPPPKPRTPKGDVQPEIRNALHITRQLMGRAEGLLTQCQGASRGQRKRLRAEFNTKIDEPLSELMAQVQIVELWVEFLYYLLEVGGIRVDTYNFGSLKTYQSNILEALYRAAWDLDLLEMNSEELAQFYRSVLGRIKIAHRDSAKTPLKRFLGYLHQWWGAPNCNVDFATESRKRIARSVIVPVRLIDRAVENSTQPNVKNATIGKVSAGLLTLNHAFGLRTKEGYGVLHRDFLNDSMAVLRVRRNAIRSLKTFERTIPVSLASVERQKALRARKTISSDLKSGAKAALFSMPGQPRVLYDYWQVVASANWSIKTATGDLNAIPYSLRHTFASSVMSDMLMPTQVASPLARTIAGSLALPPSALKQIRECQPTSDKYPLQIDRLGLWLAHQGVETLSTTYWHGAWWVAGEYCAREALITPWSSNVMGALLGVHSSGVRHRLPKHCTDSTSAESHRMAAVVKQYVVESGVPSLVNIATETDVASYAPDLSVANTLSVLGMLDALLILRRTQGGEFSELELTAENTLYVKASDAARFYKGYQEVGSEASFFDFEPDGVRAGRFIQMQVNGGQSRRRKLLNFIVEKMENSFEFAAQSRSIANEWVKNVDGDLPYLISRDVDGLKGHINWLRAIGYQPGEIVIHGYRASTDQWAKIETLGCSIAVAAHQPARLTRIGMQVEFGVEVTGSNNLPNKREFQRALFALACAVRCGIFDF